VTLQFVCVCVCVCARVCMQNSAQFCQLLILKLVSGIVLRYAIANNYGSSDDRTIPLITGR